MTTPTPATPEFTPAPEAPKSKKALKKIGGIVVAIVIAVAVKLALPHLTGEAPVHAKVGECVVVTGAENDPKVDTADCSSGKADLYKVEKVFEDTFDLAKCGEELSALAQQLNSDKFVLCLSEVKK
ncbi:hypothetical protein HHL19_30365 [Streptomyces sp. R302]|uniref:LppU/SCO3897 family protein n=1 Tax=unclassified Streptomyces TaxID=2593676 RepID=UPI00145D1ECD|nr:MULTISPECIES: hypothetical protein [unclassified Streptomyces]NML53164.1 hypothetical protein [Streptomyces sp. R301]NML82847.1 hypothetical protein [Streptomyces sp. R302]